MIIDYRVFIAVRLKSTRLAKKALLKIGGRSLISILLDNLSNNIPKKNIVLCTSNLRSDDELELISKKHSIQCFRGHPEDVISRFLEAEKLFPTKNIVRVTGDNPLTNPDLIQDLLSYHLEKRNEYTWTNSYPIGTRSEIIETRALKKIHKELVAPENSEYMTYMLNRPDKLKVGCYEVANKESTFPQVSVTVDTDIDFKKLVEIFKSTQNNTPTTRQLLQWCSTQKTMNFLGKSENSQKIDLSLYGYLDDI